MSQITVNDIDETEFNAWKHHPVSKVFFQYLRDKKDFIQQTVSDEWMSGSLKLSGDDGNTRRGQVIELWEIDNVPFQGIVNFYEETIGSEASQDDALRVRPSDLVGEE